MAQFALLIILVTIVLMLLSGGATPVESQPRWLQFLTYFLAGAALRQLLAGDHLTRGGLSAVWPQFAMVTAVGSGSSPIAWCCSASRLR